jgi:hypothetical protein
MTHSNLWTFHKEITNYDWKFILSSSKELTSRVKLQVEIFWKASRNRALQKICTCSLTRDVSSLEDDNVFVFCVAFFLVFVFYIVICIAILVHLLYNKWPISMWPSPVF